MTTTTFILGAGLGKEYGFPDGVELRNLIINELDEHEQELKKIVRIGVDLTVDEIAHRYPKHAETLRRIVVRTIHARENEETLFRADKNIYKQLLRQIGIAESKGDAAHIITFNYDRSLPHLLHEFNAIEPQERKIKASILHVHGRLAPLWHEDKGSRNRPMVYHTYGGSLLPVRGRSTQFDDVPEQYNADYYEEMKLSELYQASKINFIGNNSEPQPALKELLNESDNIVFLGVGYHSPNMQVLGFDFQNPNSKKVIVGTGLGLEEEEIEYIQRQYPALHAIVLCNAHTFLKTKFDISDPERSLYRKNASMLDEEVLDRFQQVIESTTPQLG